MKKSKFTSSMCAAVLAVVASAVLLYACSSQGSVTPSGSPESDLALTISAAASLKNAMTEAAELYKQQKPNVALNFNYGSSGDLQQQIENGAPVDVFVSAAKKQMKALEDKGLLLEKSTELLVNQLVVVVPKGKAGIASYQDLAGDKAKQIALGESKGVPAGQYAEEVFTKLGLLEKIKPKAVYGKDVTQVLTYVAQGEVDAGVVYRTDAKSMADKVDVVATAPEGSHTPVIYPGGVIKDSANPQAAKDFLTFLKSDAVKTVFEKYGFAIAEDNK